MALLDANADGTRFLESPPSALAANLGVNGTQSLAEGRGSVIGPYKLLEQIGEGGMGVVFMAEQTRPVQRRVALKIIKAGMDTRQVVARFEAERQALAMMDHPNIARVLDAGATETGRPYFVMELVRGVPMTEFCNQKNLSIRERLELFVTVCQAVQHAHQKGIIHRDIKPTNVLVTLHDGRPVIKVIDFGVAKATGQKLTDKTLFTGFTQMIGTPLYMSPEQAEMSGLDVDTRSDIFSAGVLLYELLTGTTPFDSERLKSASFDELRRIIREEEPPRPSARLTTIAAEAASTVGKERRSDARQLSRLFRGELDWIVMKCLEKDRTRRYETASALAGDVERYLHDEPVQACPPSARYRFGKFARRNKGALVATAAVMVSLLLGTVISTWQAVRAYNAEAQSKASQKQAEESLNFLVSALRSPRAERDGRTITIAEMLGRSAKELQDKFADDPLTRAKLLETIGNSYKSLGLYREAVPLLEQTRDLFIGALGREDSKTLETMHTLANCYAFVGRIKEGLPILEEEVRLRKATLGPEHRDTVVSMKWLGNMYREAGRLDEALRLDEETLKLCKAVFGPDDEFTDGMMRQLALVYEAMGRIDVALPLFEEPFKRTKARLGLENRGKLLWQMGELADLYRQAGRLKEAVSLYEETLKGRTAMLGPEDPQTLRAMSHLAALYYDVGRRDEGLLLAEKTLELIRTKRKSPDLHTVDTMMNLATAFRNAGRTDEALQLDEEALRFLKAAPGAEFPPTIGLMDALAVDYAIAGRIDEAIRLGEEALKLRTAKLGRDNLSTIGSMHNLAVTYRAAGRTNDCVRLAEEALQLRKSKLGPDHPETLKWMGWLSEAYLEAGRSDEAIRLGEESLKLRKAKLGPEHADTLETMFDLADAYMSADRLTEAEPLARDCLQIRETKFPDDWQTFSAKWLLGDLLLRQKKYAEAEPLLVSGYTGLHEAKLRFPSSISIA